MDNEFDITPENEGKLTLVEAKFILEQAEKTLKETGDQSQNIVQRTTTLTTLIASVLIAIIAFTLQRWDKSNHVDVIFLSSVFATVYLLWLCFNLVKNIQGADYYPIGSDPKTLLIDDFFSAPDHEVRQVWFYITEIKRYQEKIDYNKTKNSDRWLKFNKNLMQVTLTPLVFISLYLIITFIIKIF